MPDPTTAQGRGFSSPSLLASRSIRVDLAGAASPETDANGREARVSSQQADRETNAISTQSRRTASYTLISRRA